MTEISQLKVGMRVRAKWRGGQTYPGKIVEVQGDKVHILYDDGDQEWTTPDMVVEVIEPAPTSFSSEIERALAEKLRRGVGSIPDSIAEKKLKEYQQLVEGAHNTLEKRKQELNQLKQRGEQRYTADGRPAGEPTFTSQQVTEIRVATEKVTTLANLIDKVMSSGREEDFQKLRAL